MIVLVDDDTNGLKELGAVLSGAGYDVKAFSSPIEALGELAYLEPQLILSDVVMPEMDGFAFKAAYGQRFPLRETPFVFLSSLTDDRSVVHALDTGAEDFLNKPISPLIFLAKVRALLRRFHKRSEVMYRGNLSNLPFCSVMRFCELKGLTGSVRVVRDGFDACVQYRAGNLEDEDGGELIGSLCELQDGEFTIRAHPPDFADVDGLEATVDIDPSEHHDVAGRLSTVVVGGKRLQVQTEVAFTPSVMIVTIVTANAKALHKRTQSVEEGVGPAQIARLLEAQHRQVEDDIQQKLVEAQETLSQVPEEPREQFNYLFDKGYEHYRAGEWAKAAVVWQKAYDLDPSNKTVAINLKILKEKLEKSG